MLATFNGMCLYNDNLKMGPYTPLMAQPILENAQCILLYRISYIALFTALYALYRQHYSLIVVPGSVFLTSINYWRNPTYSWRRYLDMTVVKTTMVYQIYVGYNAQFINHCLAYWSLAIIAYLFSIHYHKKGHGWLSTYLHMLLHIFANLGNVVLYSGYIEPPPPFRTSH